MSRPVKSNTVKHHHVTSKSQTTRIARIADAEEVPVNLRNTMRIFLIITLLFSQFLISAEAANRIEQVEPSDTGWNFMRPPIESHSIEFSVSSYEPRLEQFTELIGVFGSAGFGTVSMMSAMLELRHSPQLSSRIEVGYAADELEIPPPSASDLRASFIPLSVHLLYRPIALSELMPFYIGFGAGYSYLSVAGSALDLLEQQGITFEEEDSGLTGFLITGLEFPIWGDQASVTIEAKRILKKFVANPTLDLDFDGTAIGMGIRWKL